MTTEHTKPRRARTSDQIRAEVFDLAAKMSGTPLEKMEPATRFFEDLEFDSLDIADFTMQIEETFGVRIPEGADAQSAKTLGETLELVQSLLKQSPRG